MLQVSQLLQKLRTDLHLSFHSFLKEFVAEPNDGVGFLLFFEECVLTFVYPHSESDQITKCIWLKGR